MKKILLIEDDQEIRENISEYLELHGLNLIPAANGISGYESAVKEIPDLIICDVMMWGMDGFSVLEKLKANPVTVHIPFLFLSSLSQKDEIERAKKSAADAYLIKPVEMAELLGIIRKYLKNTVEAMP